MGRVGALTAAGYAVLGLCRCAPPSSQFMASASAPVAVDRPRVAERSKLAAGDAWEVYVAAQGWPAVTVAPFVSRGHEPEQLVNIRVNEVAAATYQTLVADSILPEGAVVAELSASGGQSGANASYLMQKKGGLWVYTQVDARGSIVPGLQQERCSGCHAQAPADSLFGLPRF